MFHDENLKRMCGADVKTTELTKDKKPGTELFLLAKKCGALNRQRLEGYKKEGIHGLSIKYTLAAFLPEIKACALKTAVWTVDFRVQAAHLIKTGRVDILISNRKLFI